jgi:arylsulfatase A-like enzyme
MSQLYDGEIAYLDQNLGEFFDTLKRYDLYDNTLIIFTADHGEEFYEHGGWDHGETLYQEMVHVPLIIKYPTGAFAGMVDEDPARSLDIAPTVLDVLDIDPPPTMQGFSLHPDSRARQPATIFSEEDYEGNVLQAIRMGNHKLILANEDNPRGLALVEFYDLAADPGEQTNLSASHPEVVERLRRELDRTLAYALAHAVAGQTGELDPATRERLQQLGY